MPAAPAGYSGTPLPRKLGIKPGFTVHLVDAPDGFETALGALPAGASLRRTGRRPADLVVWFVRSVAALDHGIVARAAATGPGGLWIAWPKKASGVRTDVTQAEVRAAGLDHGLVDYKIAAIDATWSGQKFARRK